jgi:hypothetical protein
MTKGRAVTFIRSRQIGWTDRNSRSPSTSLRAGSPLRFASVGMTNSFKLDDFAQKSIKSQPLRMTKGGVALPGELASG